MNAFLNDQITRRGFALHPRHRNIAKWYRKHGQTQRVRWDYAFFQMALETNFLSFRRSNGQRGDVLPRQNNFAGLGTTGGGVRGDSYPDVSTGVLAQIQHLVVYSGQRLRRPTGHRTRLKQNVILNSVREIVRRRPVTFADLAGRWAADRRYGRSIQRLANRFYGRFCGGEVTKIPVPQASGSVTRRSPVRLIPVTVVRGRGARGPAVRQVLKVTRTGKVTETAFAAAQKPAQQSVQKRTIVKTAPQDGRAPSSFGRANRPSARVAVASMHSFTPRPHRLPAATTATDANATQSAPPGCRIQVAGYGGKRAVLIKSMSGSTTRFTALNVYPGFEAMMAQSFIKSHAPAGKTVGAFDSREAALAVAHDLCRLPGTHLGK
ncbi:MAG: hypothetical protein ACR2PI_16180 [Hyphomicrobiaceae bacterium]